MESTKITMSSTQIFTNLFNYLFNCLVNAYIATSIVILTMFMIDYYSNKISFSNKIKICDEKMMDLFRTLNYIQSERLLHANLSNGKISKLEDKVNEYMNFRFDKLEKIVYHHTTDISKCSFQNNEALSLLEEKLVTLLSAEIGKVEDEIKLNITFADDYFDDIIDTIDNVEQKVEQKVTELNKKLEDGLKKNKKLDSYYNYCGENQKLIDKLLVDKIEKKVTDLNKKLEDFINESRKMLYDFYLCIDAGMSNYHDIVEMDARGISDTLREAINRSGKKSSENLLLALQISFPTLDFHKYGKDLLLSQQISFPTLDFHKYCKEDDENYERIYTKYKDFLLLNK
jgi:hypothetical protein